MASIGKKRKAWFLIVYCLPAIIALFPIMFTNYYRLGETSKLINTYITYIERNGKFPENLITDENVENVSKPFLRALEKRKTLGELLDKCETRNDVLRHNLLNFVFITILTLLPFGLLGWGLVFRDGTEEQIKRLVRKDLFMKYLVGAVISFGWLYFFNPFGQGASTVYRFARNVDIISDDTLPLFIKYCTQMAHAVAGFFGWYLNLLTYFFFRFYRRDTISTRVYSELFKKFLFVFGISLILSSMTTSGARVVVFLIGFFPLFAVSMLREFTVKQMSTVGEQTPSLSLLPGISQWQVFRLQEEGVDNIPTLAASNADELKASIPAATISPISMDYWMDIAKLITVLGVEKYKKLEGFCMTASAFISKSGDTEFVETLRKDYQIGNPDEIANVLKKWS